VRVGSREWLAVQEIHAEAPVYPTGAPLCAPADCSVQVRAHGGVAAATVSAEADSLAALLAEPLYGVAPGQTLVAYSGDEVLAAARIASTA
jgi:tRNA-specific 2-thiouridylase